MSKITRRGFINRTLMLVGAAMLLFVCAKQQPESKPDRPKPNFVFILADDLTFRDIGVYGGQAYTPHIDQLAKEGIRFKRAFQTAPMCSPTRHTIYTGLTR